jgi:hypothetical protein
LRSRPGIDRRDRATKRLIVEGGEVADGAAAASDDDHVNLVIDALAAGGRQ